jgi:hypothetical protein
MEPRQQGIHEGTFRFHLAIQDNHDTYLIWGGVLYPTIRHTIICHPDHHYGLQLMHTMGLFHDKSKLCNRKPVVDQTWINFKIIHFTQAYNNHNLMQQTSMQSGFQVNVVNTMYVTNSTISFSQRTAYAL